MIRIDPYEFSAVDARRTVELLPALWAQLTDGRDARVVEHLRPSTDGPADDVLPRVWAALLAAGPALRAAGQLPPTAAGEVVSVHASGGGVPKGPIDRADVGWRGVAGDVQAARQHHGRPWQALCLWSAEVIDELNAEGHQLFPGAAGENVTVRGLPWADVRAGVRLQLGTVLCEVTAFAEPCRKNARWFAGGDFRRMHADRGPVSRVYARVVEPGSMATGDGAMLEP